MKVKQSTLVFCTILLIFTGASQAAETTSPSAADLEIERAWIRLLPPVMKSTAAYFVLHNHSNKPRTLLKASTTRAERAEFHETRQMDSNTSMHSMKPIVINASEKLVFTPGDKHLMLIDLNAPLKKGERIPIQFEFKNGEIFSADFIVTTDGKTEVDHSVQQHHQHHH